MSITAPANSIFWVGALDDKFQGRLGRSVAFEDSKRFIRPGDLSAGNIPSKAAGTAQSLRFGQIHFAMQQRGLNPLLILDRCLQIGAGPPESFCCLSLRRNHESDNEGCNAKQDQTRHLRNIAGEQIMFPGKRIDWGHKVTVESIDSAMGSACSKRVISSAAMLATATAKTAIA